MIPVGTVIPARGHYLLAAATFSLNSRATSDFFYSTTGATGVDDNVVLHSIPPRTALTSHSRTGSTLPALREPLLKIVKEPGCRRLPQTMETIVSSAQFHCPEFRLTRMTMPPTSCSSRQPARSGQLWRSLVHPVRKT